MCFQKQLEVFYELYIITFKLLLEENVANSNFEKLLDKAITAEANLIKLEHLFSKEQKTEVDNIRAKWSLLFCDTLLRIGQIHAAHYKLHELLRNKVLLPHALLKLAQLYSKLSLRSGADELASKKNAMNSYICFKSLLELGFVEFEYEVMAQKMLVRALGLAIKLEDFLSLDLAKLEAVVEDTNPVDFATICKEYVFFQHKIITPPIITAFNNKRTATSVSSLDIDDILLKVNSRMIANTAMAI